MRREAKESLLRFTEYTFPGFEIGRHHQFLCSKLESFEKSVRLRESPRLMIFEPPRHTKSELASRRFPAWAIGRNPLWQFITATYSGDFAADFGREVRNIVDSGLYQNVFPDVTLRPDSKAANRWNTSSGGTYVAAGVGGPLTGRGAHVFLIDDPFKDWDEANSETIRNARWNWYLTVARTRLMPGAGVILIMTRWHDDDIAGRLIAQMETGGEQFEIVNLPALAVEGDQLGREVGEALWPEWYGRDELLATRGVLPVRHWNALYQQNPIPDEGDYFKAEWIQWYDQAPKHLSLVGCSDYAVTDGAGDWTEHGVAGLDSNDDLYILDWWRDQKTSEIWIESQLDLAQKWSVKLWGGESGPIKKSIEPFLLKRMRERRIYMVLEWLSSVVDKPTRARAIQARFSMRKVFLPKTPWAEELVRQLLRFPAGAVDDGIDVLSLFGRMLDVLITNQTNKFIPPEVVHLARERTVDVLRGSTRIMSIRSSREDKSTVIARRHGYKLEKLIKLRGYSSSDVIHEIATAIKESSPDVTIFDDTDGGVEIIERLRALGYRIINVNSEGKPESKNKNTHFNKRAESWDRMREWLINADIPYDDMELSNDLLSVEYDNKARRDLMRLETEQSTMNRGLAFPICANALAIGFAYETPPVHIQGMVNPLPEWHRDM